MEIVTTQKIEDSRNYAKDYREELKYSKKLKEHLKLEINEVQNLRGILKESGMFGKDLQKFPDITLESLQKQKNQNSDKILGHQGKMLKK